MRRRLLYRLWGRIPIPLPLRYAIVRLGVAKFPVGVIAVVRNEAGEILLFKHTYRGRYPWGLPGGWLKRGENPNEALKREIAEETGLKAHVGRMLLARSEIELERLDLYFECRIESGSFRPSSEVVEMGWWPPGRLPAMLDSQYDMIHKVLNLLEDHPTQAA